MSSFSEPDERIERSAGRYLDLLKGALLNEHYIEHELRIAHLVDRIERERPPDPHQLRDPARHLRDDLRLLLNARRAGHPQPAEGTTPDGSGLTAAYFPYTTMGRARLDGLERCLDRVREESTPGDLADCGTGRGGGAMFMRGYLAAHEMADRTVWVADTFRSSPAPGRWSRIRSRLPGGGPGFPDLTPDLNTVRDGFDRMGLFDERVRFLQGRFDHTLPDAPIEHLALLRIGGGLGSRASDALDALYDRVSVGGFVVIDDYGTGEVCEAVDAFRARRGVADPLDRIDWAGAVWRKSAEAPHLGARDAPVITKPARAPLAPPAPGAPVALSVVVVFYDMQREAARTLHSLSRSYQHDVADLDYEVIVVDNGSRKQPLDEEFVRSFGPEFRFVDMGEQATPSPVDALNRGIAVARGENIALMIDGAHVLTPGVLRYGMTGLREFAPSIVVTQQWHLGPGQQSETMNRGYDQAFEDRLFDAIQWPADGYRLFEIGHFAGDRDWFDGLWESNCIFAPRRLLEQVGGFDEAFSMAGGGFANLEIYERLGLSPDTNVVTLIGEGSFHQVHGGTTTNSAQSEERRGRISSYAQHYADLRGREFRGPGKKLHYVGAMPPAGLRTRARRLTPKHFAEAGTAEEGLPTTPTPIPEELQQAFLDAFWRNLAWRETTWLGETVGRPPTDLMAYQELVTKVRPDWIIEFSTLNGAKALFFASICEMLGHGQVISIDHRQLDDRPEHPRITYLRGQTTQEPVADQVRKIVGDSPRALVVINSYGARLRTLKEFELFSAFVPVGSYVVIEDTIVNGHPVWPSHGPGPSEAVSTIMKSRGDFVPDPDYEKYGVSFNHEGFLKRVKAIGEA